MFLQHLDITGFKSFAHKTVLEFDRGIASIVGPNGSGKSNVADAIRWALGEQSMKLLRGKRSDDVIFSGSALKARLGMAEVSLTFNNEDHQMPVDYTEVVITRRMYRNGEGEYLMNKHPVRLQDIQLLLAKSNIGQKSYSVIGQGMIDHVLVASPAERKIFFDEAAGVRQFQIKRDQALAKLELTKENLSQVQMLLTEIEPRLRTLTRQVRRLERRGAVEQELRGAQQQYYRQRYGALTRQLTDLETAYRKQYARQEHHEQALQTLQHDLETMEKERSRQDVFQELQRDYSKVLEQKNAIVKEQVMLEGAQELEAARSGGLNTVWLENRQRELERAQHDLEEEIGRIETQLTEQQQKLSKREEQLRATAEQLAALERQFEKTKEQAGQKDLPLDAVTHDLGVLHEEFLTFREKMEKAENEQHLQKLKREVARFADVLGGIVRRLRGTRPRVQPADLLKLQEDFRRLHTAKDELLSDIHELAKQNERQQERLALLTESRSRLSDERERVGREYARLKPSGKAPHGDASQRTQLEERIEAFDQELQDLRERIVNFNQEEQKKKDRLFELQKAFRVRQNELSSVTAETNATRVEQAKLETRRDDLAHEIRAELPADLADTVLSYSAQRTEQPISEEKLLAAINDFKHQLELIGGIDEGVTEEFHQTDERYGFLSKQVEDLERSIASLEQVIAELDTTIKEQFHKAFMHINREFGKYFTVLFNGGSAKLVLQETELVTEEKEEATEDDEDEEKEKTTKRSSPKKKEKVIAGIDIIATPPGKRISGIAMLSGGERALTSIALICAILANRPSPFVVLDEVDAALDEANTQRFAAILKELAHKTQFITITHNRSTMQISSILYGITMSDDGMSKLLSIKMEEAENVIAQHGNRR